MCVRIGLKWYRDRYCARVNDSHKAGRVEMARQWEEMNFVDPDWMARVEFTDEVGLF